MIETVSRVLIVSFDPLKLAFFTMKIILKRSNLPLEISFLPLDIEFDILKLPSLFALILLSWVVQFDDILLQTADFLLRGEWLFANLIISNL